MPTDTWRNLPDDKRARVLNAAMREFGERGFAAGSLNVIAREAGVAKGSLFQYFMGKADFFTTVCTVVAQDIRDNVVQDIDPADEQPYFDRLRSIVRRWLVYFREHPLERSIAVVSIAELDQDTKAIVRAASNRHFADVFRPLVEQGAARGEFAAGVDVDVVLSLSVLLLRHLHSVPFDDNHDPALQLAKREPSEVERTALHMVELLEHGVRHR